MVIWHYIRRCASKCIMIPFRLPQFPCLSHNCGIAVEGIAFLIGLGEKFFSSGVTEVDRDFIPTILRRVPSSLTSRVIPLYALLLWSTLEVNKQTNENKLGFMSMRNSPLSLLWLHALPTTPPFKISGTSLSQAITNFCLAIWILLRSTVGP